MKKIMQIISMCAIANISYAAQIQKEVPLSLAGRYNHFIRRIENSNSNSIDDAARTEAQQLLYGLRDFQAPEQISRLEEILRIPASQTSTCVQTQTQAESKEANAEMQSTHDEVPTEIIIHANKIDDSDSEDKATTTIAETISGEPYRDLIALQKEHGDPFVLARVISTDKSGRPYTHYYEAHGFNKWRFGNYPLSNRQLSIVNATDPTTRQVVDTVQYFRYDPKFPQRGFRLWFTEHELLQGRRSNYFRLRLEANQNFDQSLKVQAWLNLSSIYARGDGVQKDFKKMYRYLLRIAQQTANPQAIAFAWEDLGLAYLNGFGVEKDLEMAMKYFNLAAQQTDNTVARAMAYESLAQLYLNGYQGPEKKLNDQQRLTLAIKYFIVAENQTADQVSRSYARYNLGNIYQNGQGVEKNFREAAAYYHKLLKEPPPAAQKLLVNAQHNLGDIYYEGGFGVEQNWSKAAQYYEEVLRSQDSYTQKYIPLIHYRLGLISGSCAQRNPIKIIHHFEAAGLQNKDKATSALAWKSLKAFCENMLMGDDLLSKAVAQYKLGEMFLKGWGVDKNYMLAAYYLNLAAQQTINPEVRTLAQNLLKILADEEEKEKVAASQALAGQKHGIGGDEAPDAKRPKGNG